MAVGIDKLFKLTPIAGNNILVELLQNKIKHNSKIIKISSNKKKIVISVIIFVLLLSLYKSDRIMIEIPQKLSEQVSARTNLDFFPLWQRITGFMFRSEDEINIFRIKKNLLDGELPIYDLELNPKDLVHFDDLSKDAIKAGYLPPDLNDFRNAKLFVNGEKYSVNVRFHGDTPPHWANELKSYLIKTNANAYINNMRRFSLLIFEDRLFAPMIGRIVAKNFGLMDIRDSIVVLQLNGVIQGVYYLEEKLETNSVEYNECSNCYVISLRDNWVQDHKYDVEPYKSADPNGITWETGHRTPFDYELANANVDDTLPGMKNVLNRLDSLYGSVNDKNLNVADYFDMEQLSSFQAFRMILGNVHSIAGDNFRMVYRLTNSKFYPVPLVEVSTRLKLQNGGIGHYLNTFGKPIDLFYLIARDDELKYLTHKKVYSYILNNTLLDEYDKMVEKYSPYVLSYKTNNWNSRHLKYAFKEQRDILQYNMEIIRKNLEYSKLYAKSIQKGNEVNIEFIPDSIAEIKFKKFAMQLGGNYTGEVVVTSTGPDNKSIARTLNINDKTSNIDLTDSVKDIYFSAGLDENLYPSVRRYQIKITFSDASKIDVNSLDINMKNDITGADIAQDDIYVNIADANNYYENSKHQSFEEFQKKYKNLKWNYNNGELTLLEGDYIVDNNLIVPKFNNFIIQAGVNIKIAENKSILSYSPVTIDGTKDKRVVITSLEKDRPYGTFAIVGEGTPDEKTVINWLDLSNGNQDWINDMFFSGQISIYHISNVYINNSLIHGSHSDDGINVKYANIIVDNSRFYGNSADQLDMDFVKGFVKNSVFDGSGELSSNGDGLDLSGSRLIVKNSKFLNNKDKGISVGENTRILVYKGEFANNNIGTAVKDLSNGYYLENAFKSNKIAVDAYQKKQLFGGAKAYVYDNVFSSNQQDFNQDNQSKIYKLEIPTENYKILRDNAEKEVLGFPEG